MIVIVDNKKLNRFELEADGYVAVTNYDLKPGIIVFTHTQVPNELAGKGVGSRLVKGALDQARSEGLKVVADCPFVKSYIEKHAEYAALLA
jgi:predicted GNAT family acetyltransferase